jgi:predicted Holliday junction resolvase-like endonuclease
MGIRMGIVCSCFFVGIVAVIAHQTVIATILLVVAALAAIDELLCLKDENRRLRDKVERQDRKVMRIFREAGLVDEKLQPEDLEDRELTFVELEKIREISERIRKCGIVQSFG